MHTRAARTRRALAVLLSIAGFAAVGCAVERGGSRAAPGPAGPSGACASGMLCFAVRPGAPGPLGAARVLVMWVSPNDDDGKAPEIGFETSLAPGQAWLSFPLSAVRAPHVFGGYSPHAWGYVVVVAPGSPMPPTKSSFVGVGNMMLAHSVNAAFDNQHLRGIYPAGVAQGTAPYFMDRQPGRSHDKLLLAQPGSVFDLVVCPVTAPSCDLPFPNPS